MQSLITGGLNRNGRIRVKNISFLFKKNKNFETVVLKTIFKKLTKQVPSSGSVKKKQKKKPWRSFRWTPHPFKTWKIIQFTQLYRTAKDRRHGVGGPHTPEKLQLSQLAANQMAQPKLRWARGAVPAVHLEDERPRVESTSLLLASYKKIPLPRFPAFSKPVISWTKTHLSLFYLLLGIGAFFFLCSLMEE